MLTTKTHKKLIRDAFRKFRNDIKPIGKAKSFCDPRNFTRGVGKIYGGRLMFWFEDAAGSTHIVTEGINEHLPN